jgi:DNA-binding NarL/FixJ family response regulator
MASQSPIHPERKQIFIVDDHPVFREGLVVLVKRESELAVCGEADTAAAALTEIKRLQPDLVLADIGLPGKSGMELIKDLQAVCPEIPILVISMHDESLYAERVLRAGGRGYIMKQEGPEKILQAIRQILAGQLYLSPKMSTRVLDSISGRSERNRPAVARLTDRELEILQLLGQGKDSHAIAAQLNLSVKTVDAHRGNIKEKLSLESGTELIWFAARWVATQESGNGAN